MLNSPNILPQIHKVEKQNIPQDCTNNVGVKIIVNKGDLNPYLCAGLFFSEGLSIDMYVSINLGVIVNGIMCSCTDHSLLNELFNIQCKQKGKKIQRCDLFITPSPLTLLFLGLSISIYNEH